MPNFVAPHCGSALAFDFGTTRIGVAQGEASVAIAHPLETISGSLNQEKFARIATLITQWQPEFLVVGLPTYIDGTEHELTRLSRKFGRQLHGRFTMPVYWVDERLSSLYAEELLRQAGVRGRKQKSILDAVAAQAILQSFFENGATEFWEGRK